MTGTVLMITLVIKQVVSFEQGSTGALKGAAHMMCAKFVKDAGQFV